MGFYLQEQYVNLLTDFEFKRVFGSEQAGYQDSLKYYRDLNNVVNTAEQEGLKQGRAEGRAEAEKAVLQRQRQLVSRLLRQSLGRLDGGLQGRVNALSIAQVERLIEALMSFEAVEDLRDWLEKNDV